jgi:transposase
MNRAPANRKEARYRQAWYLKQKAGPSGRSPRRWGSGEGVISQWMRRAREGGLAALRHRSQPGATRRLSADQLARLPILLHRGPAAYGFQGQLWTRRRVAEVIRVEVGVVYHLTHVGRLLNALHWSPRKPARCAHQRDEAAIARWRDETWSTINGGHKPRSRRCSS